MSHEYVSWAWRVKTGNSARKIVLVAIADTANADGLSWPGQQRLANQTEMTDRSIRTHLAALEAAGFIRRERRVRTNGSRTSDYIRLPPMRQDGMIDRWPLPETSSGSSSAEPTGKSFRTYRKDFPSQPESLSAPEPSGEPSVEPSVSPPPPPSPNGDDSSNAEGRVIAKVQGGRPIKRADLDRIVGAYNEHRGRLPQVRLINRARERKLKSFVRDVAREAKGDGDPIDRATEIMAIATAEVAHDPFWQKNAYNIDNLLAGQKLFGKAEAAVSRGSVDRSTSTRDRILNAIGGGG